MHGWVLWTTKGESVNIRCERIATTPDKTSRDKPKTRAYFFLTGNGNTIIVAEMLSLPPPSLNVVLKV